MCVCLHVFVCVCVFVRMCVYVCEHVCVHVCAFTHMHMEVRGLLRVLSLRCHLVLLTQGHWDLGLTA